MVKTFNFFSGVVKTEGLIWKTHTGRETPVEWLTTNHIHNILNCLEGRGDMEIPEPYLGKSRWEWIIIFDAELYNRR